MTFTEFCVLTLSQESQSIEFFLIKFSYLPGCYSALISSGLIMINEFFQSKILTKANPITEYLAFH